MPAAIGELRLDGIVARPSGRGPVLAGVDLRLGPGERVAVLGPSGAGKSTLLAVLLRFVEPAAGVASFAGLDLTEVDPRAWRERLAWVPQRPLLEPGSVDAAVRLGREGGDVAGALVAAGASSLVARLDAEVDELSAGERRRVALARALLRDAPILLLDEPTAHLDAAAAATVVAAIAALPRTRTVLVVTHDERIARAVDRVCDLRDGRLVERRRVEAA